MESALCDGAGADGLRLIETMRWDGARVVRLDLHMARLASGARSLGWPCDTASVAADVQAAALRAADLRRAAMQGAAVLGTDGWGADVRAANVRAAALKGADGRGAAGRGAGVQGADGRGAARLRLTMDAHGVVAVEAGPLPAPAKVWHVGVADQRLVSGDPWLGIKSTRRKAYDAARGALAAGLDEAVLLNERGEVCDGTITTVFFDSGAGMRTPPLSSGVLPGVLRAEMGLAEEVLNAADLGQVQLWVGNSLRGLMRAEFVG